jgi:hypothetical protein
MAFDFLKKVGLMEDEKPKQEAPATKGAATPQAVSAPQVAAPVSADQPVGQEAAASVLDVEKLKESLREQVANLEAFKPVAELKRVAGTMKSSVSGDAQKFQVASEITGITLEHLTPALEAVPGVLAQEAQKFADQFVASKTQEIEGVKNQANSLEAQIAQATTALHMLTEQRASLVAQSIKQQGELDKAKIDFQTAASTVETEFKDFGKNLVQYLGVKQ